MTALRLPHFIIAGAPRTGTTWLYELADRHPEISMARPRQPEPKFFLVDELYERGLAYYSATWFAGLPDRMCYGEKTTNYLESPSACLRIAHDLPGVKLIFLLRDPVDRAYSNYLWSRQNGIETESFARVLELEASREREMPSGRRYARPHAYFSRGLYAELLRPWLERFSRDRVLILRMEDIAANSRAVALTFQRFVGVTLRPELADGLGKVNTSHPEGAAPIDPALRDSLAERYRQPNADLRELLGPAFAGWPYASLRS